MRTEINASSIRRLIHIVCVAVVMTCTLGGAVVVSGKPTEPVSASTHFAPQTPSSDETAVLASAASVPTRRAPAAVVDVATPRETQLLKVEPQPKPRHRVVKMVVTAYCPCTKCCGENAVGITASGKHVSHNDGLFVAADRSLPFGTKLIIPGYAAKPVEVLDRGGAIKGNRLDVYFDSHQEALEWGRQTLEVTILD